MTHNPVSFSRMLTARLTERKNRSWPRNLTLAVMVCTFGIGLFLPGVASAAFTREFLRQLTAPFSVPGGVAVDSSDDLWVGSVATDTLDEFEPASAGNGLLSSSFKTVLCVADPGKGRYEDGECLTATSKHGAHGEPEGAFESVGAVPGSVAVESALLGNGDVYVTNPEQPLSRVAVFEADGGYVESWREFASPDVVVADSPSGCGLGECTVYVGEDRGVVKLNSKGTEGAFTAKESYISAGTITGTGEPGCGQSFETAVNAATPPLSVAVDAQGEIFVAIPSCNRVFEYLPTGEYERELNLASPGVPRLGGVVATPRRVAVDASSDHLLVSVVQGAVYEFDTETGEFVAEITQAGEGAIGEPREMAVDSAGDAYVADASAHAVDVWGPGGYFPTLVTGAVSGLGESSVVLSGSVDPLSLENPAHAALSACHFQYVTEATFKHNIEAHHGLESEGFAELGAGGGEVECVPAPGSIEANDTPQPVHAELTGLTSGVTYRYRLLASTEPAKKGGTAAGRALALTAVHKPVIVSSAAENLSSTSADLHAQIDPSGAQTSYYFQYGSSEAYGQDAPLLTPEKPDGTAIGAGGPTGGALESVLQHVGGLAPGSEYHFRVVAVNQAGVEYGPDMTFATLPAPVSSERGYELVTPADKQGGSDMFAEPTANGTIHNTTDVGIPAENGEGFLLRTESGFGAFPFAFTDQYVFKREAQNDGWSYTSLASPSLGVQEAPAELSPASPDLERVTLDDSLGSFAGEEGITVMSLTGPPGGPYITLHKDPALHSAGEFAAGTASTLILGASENLSHVILESHDVGEESHGPGICPGAEIVKHGAVLCEWAGGYETLEGGEEKPALGLVNTAPGEETAPTSQCGARLGAGNSAGLAHGAVSSDGSRVFFTAPDPQAQNKGAGCWNGIEAEAHEGPKNAPQLYARVATGEGAHQVLDVSAPEAGVLEGGGAPVRYPVAYVGASTDGSRVFFLTETWMTQNHPQGHDAELYECEIVVLEGGYGCSLSRLSTGEAGMEGEKEGAHVMFVPAVAAEGTSVYFTAFNKLTANATHYPVMNQSQNGHVNLYRYNLETRRTSYVTAVDTFDYPDVAECSAGIPEEAAGIPPCNLADWYVTPDGRYLLFGASTEVDGYNQVAGGCAEQTLPRAQAHQDGRCSELYRYDGVAGEEGKPAVVCVSCGAGVADSAGNAEFARSSPGDGSSGAVRGMSDNGEYVFFDSQAALVPEASNHTLDVYQWREDLATGARSVSLVGSGTDTAPTFFLGYAPNSSAETEQAREAGNVFIGTHARLSPVQTNSVGNIYDARACEPQSPCIEPPAGETGQCEGSSCQVPPPAPADPTQVLLAPLAPVGPTVPVVVKTPAQVRAEHLAAALKACKRVKVKRKRVACEKQARRKYGPAKKAKAKKASNDRRSK